MLAGKQDPCISPGDAFHAKEYKTLNRADQFLREASMIYARSSLFKFST
jgi:hypothetical protein